MEREKSKTFVEIAPGEGYAFNYTASRLDRNALFALNQVYCKEKIALVRQKYHRAFLNIHDLREDLMGFGSFKPPRSHTDAYYAILESVDIDCFGKSKVVPITHGAVAKHPNLPGNKSPGLPLKTLGYNTKRQALDDPAVLSAIRAKWYAIERSEDVVLPDVACYARAQICSRDKNKIRATWGYPLEVYLTEGQYFYPLLDELKLMAQPKIAYGLEVGNGGMHYINEMAKAPLANNFLIGDWSKFDKNVPAWMIRDAFNLIARHIDFTQVRDIEGKLWPVRETKSKKRFRAMVKYFIDTPVQMSSGERFIKHGGVPSGSCFTNIIDSVVNAIATRYLVYEMTGQMVVDDVYLGDDIFAITYEQLNLELFAKLAQKEFGFEFNVEKSYQTSKEENIHFLGYFNLNGVPYKPVDTVIASSLYPERPVEDKFETITRLVGQAYSCFDPEDAKRFFLAADILRKELPGLTTLMIEEFIQNHPQYFKYLQTIGVSVRQGIRFPSLGFYDLTWVTLPRPPRKVWKPNRHNLEHLAYTAYLRVLNEIQDVI